MRSRLMNFRIVFLMLAPCGIAGCGHRISPCRQEVQFSIKDSAQNAIAGATVSLRRKVHNSIVWSGDTDQNGTARINVTTFTICGVGPFGLIPSPAPKEIIGHDPYVIRVLHNQEDEIISGILSERAVFNGDQFQITVLRIGPVQNMRENAIGAAGSAYREH